MPTGMYIAASQICSFNRPMRNASEAEESHSLADALFHLSIYDSAVVPERRPAMRGGEPRCEERTLNRPMDVGHEGDR